ncbi:hypothetical protein FS749_004392 [Ceratobasidium sp. UAMH 11750]|nr:hypothetical protein FS749_004392 [Ceratobasidium sp. UAMH 11750]
MIPFSSKRKAMGVVVRTPNGKWWLYLKGASEILTKMCKRYVVVCRPGSQSLDLKEVETAPITELEEENISCTIIFYANQMLRTLALAYRDFEQWPPAGHTGAIDEVPYESIANDLTLIGIVGIEDPLRAGVKEAIQKCLGAGVTIKVCTGDNVLTARSIASQCSIFTAGGIIMKGPVFRKLSTEEQREIVPRLQVLARSSPEDKRILVDTLKTLGEIVGVTGDGTNDGPALKHANVGFSMGIAGAEIAKEASDIILMDDNFASVVSAIMWGRCVNDSVLIEGAIQILIVFFGAAAFQVTSTNGRDWGMSIALGFVSIPLGFLIHCIPTPPVECLFVALCIMRDPNAPPKLTRAEKKEEAERKREEEKERWNPAINQVRDRLETFSNIRGARMHLSSFVCKS